MIRPNLKTFATVVVAILLTMAGAQAAPMAIDAKDVKPIHKFLDGTIALTDELLEKAAKAVQNNAIMNTIITHSTSGFNHWQVTDSYKNRAEALGKALGNSSGSWNAVRERYYMSENVSFYELQQNLFVRSLEGDAGNPTDSERAKAMVTLKERANKLKSAAQELKKYFYSDNFGEVALLSESGQTDLYFQWLRFKKNVEALKPAVEKDMSAARAGSMDLKALSHYKPSGLARNYWALTRGRKNEFTDIYNKMWNHYKPLIRKGVEPSTSFNAMGVSQKLGDKIEWDLGAAEEDDAYNACEKVMALIAEAEAAFKKFDEGFRESVPNADERIKAAENKIAGVNVPADDNDNSSDDTDNDTSDDNDGTGSDVADTQQDSINLGGITADSSETDTNNAANQTQYATQGGTYTVQDNDQFGQITKEKLKQAFLDAGWKEEDIPGLWGAGGLVELLAQFNNIQNANVINTGQEIKIPPVPKPPADESNRQEAFQSWAGSLGDENAVSQPVTDNGNSSPSNEQSSAMSEERILTEVGAFTKKYFINPKSHEELYTFLAAKPKNADYNGTNGDLLLWSVDVNLRSIQKFAKENNGNVTKKLGNVYQKAMNLRKALVTPRSQQAENHMVSVTNAYMQYLKALELIN